MTTALITGASGGIGLELAKVLAADHCDLILVARSADKLAELAQDLRQRNGVKVLVLAKDLSLAEAGEEIYRATRAAGYEVDYLVNNAGVGYTLPFPEAPWAKDRQLLGLNILALTQLTKLFLPDMLRRGHGRILNLASTAAFQPGPLMALYYASKAFVLSFSEALAEEVRGTGVTVTALCPGPVATGFQENAGATEMRLLKFMRPVTPAAVARYGYRALVGGKTVAIPGFGNWLGTFAVRFFPRAWIRRTAKRLNTVVPDARSGGHPSNGAIENRK